MRGAMRWRSHSREAGRLTVDDLHVVLLRCGHWFDEHVPGPTDFNDPSWKQRVCGHPDHYPARYDAVYLPASCIPPWAVLSG